ncbi:MAG: hypothetical protein K6E59_01090 [Bacilli bacterium]|nr:hypothetical protein [Bacilli bacterium]
MNPLLLAIAPRLKESSLPVLRALSQKGYPYQLLEEDPKDGDLVLLFLDLKSTKEELFDSFPWLEAQYEYSSLKGFRLMPFLMYHGKQGDIESLYEENLADMMDEVISGEFKPFGFDLDAGFPLEEFPAVLESYSE